MKKALSFFFAVALSTALLSACSVASSSKSNNSPSSDNSSEPSGQPTHSEYVEVTFKNYNAEILFYTSVKYGGTAVYQGETPTRPPVSGTAYYFVGWDKPLENVTQDTTFIAQFSTESVTHTVRWLNYDGQLLETSKVVHGEIPSYPGTTPTRESDYYYDYTFSGWDPTPAACLADASYTAQYTSTPKESSSSDEVKLTITYDVYNPRTGAVAVSYDSAPSNMGSFPSNKTYKKGDNVSLSAYCYTGYEFIGWYYGEHKLSYESSYNFVAWDKDMDITCRLRYQFFNLTIQTSNSSYGYVGFSVNQHTTSGTYQYFYTEEVTIYAFAQTDVRFIGWYIYTNQFVNYDAVYTFKMSNYDTSLRAVFNYFTIGYELNGGYLYYSNPYSYSYDKNNRYLSFNQPYKTGYKFLGWSMNNSDWDVFDELDTALLQDVYLYARWEPISYKIVFHPNCEDYDGYMSDQYFTYDSGQYLYTNNFYRYGYNFTGWYYNEDGYGTHYNDGDYVYNLTTTDDDVIDLYASWTPIVSTVTLYVSELEFEHDVTVHFDCNGGTGSIADQVIDEYTSLVYPNSIPTRSGYAFNGWYTDANCYYKYDFNTNLSEDTTLYAGWTSMNSSYNSRTYVDPRYSYNSSSDYYYMSCSSTSSSYRNYVYMTALNEGYHYIYYRNGSSSSYYYIYLYIYNVTQGTTIKSNGTISNTSYSSYSFYADAGDVIYVSAYRYNSSYSPTLYLYFTGFETPSASAYGYGTSHVYQKVDLTYGEYFYLPHAFTYEDHTFLGWFDQWGNQITDADGYSLEPWGGVSNTTLYAGFDEIEYDWYLKGTMNGWTHSAQYALKQCDEEIIDTAIHQYKITIDLDALDEFKINDLGENWIGYSNIEEGGLKGNFYAGEDDNIVTDVAGSYVIYFKVYTEGYSIYIGSAI